MKAWVIKTKKGYVGYAGTKHKLNEAAIYSTKKRAEEDNIHYSSEGEKYPSEGEKGDEAIPIEIKLIKGRK